MAALLNRKLRMKPELAQPGPAELIEGPIEHSQALPDGRDNRRNRIASDRVGVGMEGQQDADEGRLLVRVIGHDLAAEIEQVPLRGFDRLSMRGQLLERVIAQNAVIFQDERARIAQPVNLFEQQDMRQPACPMTGLQIASFVRGKIGRRERSSKAREWDLKAGQTGIDSSEAVGVGVAVEDIASLENPSNRRIAARAIGSSTICRPPLVAPLIQVAQK